MRGRAVLRLVTERLQAGNAPHMLAFYLFSFGDLATGHTRKCVSASRRQAAKTRQKKLKKRTENTTYLLF